MASSDQKLVFPVRRSAPVLVAPAVPTPHEFKTLSDIDDQQALRFQIPSIQFYRHNPSLSGRDPAKIIRKALSKALVSYYPFAGRLREVGDNRKLVLECTGEGVLFVEADADVRLTQFGDLQPPFPCFEELLYNVEGSGGILGCPLLLIQVTRLACGGFIFALRLNHTMSDAAGLLQFEFAVAEFARGEPGAPSVAPVWERHLLDARHPPLVTCTHREYDEVPGTKGTIIPLDDMTQRSFFFGPREVAVLRASFPSRLPNRSTLDIITGFLWRCRTIALGLDPDEEVRVVCVVNARKFKQPPLPEGYYGNALAFPVAVTTAGQLCGNPLEYAVELVGKAKAVVTDEYMRSLADFVVINKGRSYLTLGSYLLSDLRRAGFGDVDFGWGKPVYGGAVTSTFEVSFYVPRKNAKGEVDGVVIPVCLPDPVMNRFMAEIEKMTNIAVFLPSSI